MGTLAALLWAAAQTEQADVVCRVDSDTLFVPENLRRILACRNFSADVPWAIGYENYVHKHSQPGHAFLSGGNGICLSRRALSRLREAHHRGDIRESSRPGAWALRGCVSALGHWDDVVLGSCMAAFGISLSRWGTDCHGRNLFWPHRLEAALPGPRRVQPPTAPPRATLFAAPSGTTALGANGELGIERYQRWRYRSWQYLACNPSHWIGDFPVSFHPYRNATEARAAFATLRQQRVVRGYTPRIWSGRWDQCDDLWC